MTEKIILRKINEMSKKDKGIQVIAASTGSGKTHSVKTHVQEKSDLLRGVTKKSIKTVVYISEKKEMIAEVINEINEKNNKISLEILNQEGIWKVIEKEMEKGDNKTLKKDKLNEEIKIGIKEEYEKVKKEWDYYTTQVSNFNQYEVNRSKENVMNSFSKLLRLLSKNLNKIFSRGCQKGDVEETVEKFVAEVNRNESLYWLKKVFAYDFINDVTAISLTYKMLLYTTRSIKGRTEWLKSLSEGNFLIICDEIEEGKRVLKEHLIEETYNNAVPIIESLIAINEAIKRDIPEIISDEKIIERLKTTIDILKADIDEHFPNGILSDKHFLLGKEAKKLNEENIKLSFYNSFRGTYISKQVINSFILNNRKSYIELEKCDNNKQINSISTLKKFILNGSRIINYFSQVVLTAATYYSKSTETDDISIINASGTNPYERGRTVREWFGIKADSKLAIISEYFKNKRTDTKSEGSWEDTYNREFYKDGFEDIILRGKDYAKFDAFRYQINTTPEEIILTLAKNNPVILMSATVTFPHHKNINLEYLKNNLDEHFYEWSEDDAREIEKEMKYHVLNKEVNFKVLTSDYTKIYKGSSKTYLDEEKRDLENFIAKENLLEEAGNKYSENYFPTEVINKISFKINKSNKDKVRVTNSNSPYYIYFVKNLYYLLKNDCKSSIIFFNPVLNIDLLRELADVVVNYFIPHKKDTFNIQSIKASDLQEDVRNSSKSSEKETGAIEEMRKSYAEGKSIFLVTTYASASKGSNIKWLPNQNEELIHVLPEGRKKDEKRTFESIVLGPITHAFALRSRELEDEVHKYYKSELEILYELEELNAMNVLSHGEYNDLISSTIGDKESGYGNYPSLHALKRDNYGVRRVYNYYVTGIAFQALGRLFRSTGFSKETTAIISDGIFDSISDIVYEPEFVSLSKNPIMMKIAEMASTERKINAIEESEGTVNNDMLILQNILSTSSSNAETIIKKLVGVGMNSNESESKTAIKQYEKIRTAIFEHGAYLSLEEGAKLREKYPFFDKFWVKISNYDFQKFEYWYSSVNTKNGIVYNTSLNTRGGWTHFANDKRFEDRFLEFSVFKKYLLEKGFSVNEQKLGDSFYTLNPYSYFSLYKGVFAEEFFFFISRHFNLGFKKNDDLETFELADGISNDKKIAVDVKSYDDTKRNLDDVVRKILNFKADKLNVDKYYIINVDPKTKGVFEEDKLNSMQKEYVTAAGRKITITAMQLTLSDQNGQIIYHRDNLRILENITKESKEDYGKNEQN